jgi:hypothetical protein
LIRKYVRYDIPSCVYVSPNIPKAVPEDGPEVECIPCGRRMTIEALKIHYLDSPYHPTCFQCGLGFKDDTSLEDVRRFNFVHGAV